MISPAGRRVDGVFMMDGGRRREARDAVWSTRQQLEDRVQVGLGDELRTRPGLTARSGSADRRLVDRRAVQPAGRRPRVGVLRVRVQESVQPDRHDLPGQTEPVLESTAFDPPPTPLGQHDPMIVHLVTVGTLPITDIGAANADAVMPSKVFGSVASCSARLEPPSIAR